MARAKPSTAVSKQRSNQGDNDSNGVLKDTRNRHWKSRGGCYHCKRRKIKCQETLPSCENCIRLSLTCRYLTASANPSLGQAVTLHEGQIFSMTDMRLFHHFFVAAYPHFPVRNDNIWISYITPISHQCDFLMHAILALSASHLEKLSSSGLTNVAQTHRLAAIKGLNCHLDKPLRSAEDGDTIIATCFALLMQSWYMDDGLESFLVMTRSCDLMTKYVRAQKISSILADDNSASRVERMRTRLLGPICFDLDFLASTSRSLDALEPLCNNASERKLLSSLQQCVTSMSESNMKAYLSHMEIDSVVISMEHSALLQLLDPQNVVSQVLLAHLVALHLMLRPIVCRERKHYTVTMFSIRMSKWIEVICGNVGGGYEELLAWPVYISKLHIEGTLDAHSLARTSPSTKLITQTADETVVESTAADVK